MLCPGSATDGMGAARVPVASKQPAAANEGQGWITGVAGRAWSYVTNEAAALDGAVLHREAEAEAHYHLLCHLHVPAK